MSYQIQQRNDFLSELWEEAKIQCVSILTKDKRAKDMKKKMTKEHTQLNQLLKEWKEKKLSKDGKTELLKLLEHDLQFRKKVGDTWAFLLETGWIHYVKKFKVKK